MSGWSIVFWLIVTFSLLYPMNRWIGAHAQGVAFLLTGRPMIAIWVFWILFLPGTLLKNFSHWLTATLLGVKTGRFFLWPKVIRKGELRLSAMQVVVTDPVRLSLIGLAPLIFGSIAILLIGRGVPDLNQLVLILNSGDREVVMQAVNTLAEPDVWLWVYLMFAIPNTMLPNTSDRQAWWVICIYFSLVLFLILGLGLNPAISPQLQGFGLILSTHLLYAFIITVGVDVVFILSILMIEANLSWILGRRVQYNR